MVESSAAGLSAAQQIWLTHLQRQQASGLSMATYARQHGLTPSTFYNMNLKLRRLTTAHHNQALSLSPLFQPVTLLPEPVPTAAGPALTLTFQLPGAIVCELRHEKRGQIRMVLT